jgi:5-methylcytosine-specific restriction endonuclease McrA
MYAKKCLCQMHYFRFMRHSDYGVHREPRKQLVRSNAKGYVMLYAPEHPLAMRDGFVYEHRFMVYARYGDELPDCELCGAHTFWSTCHIDHRDDVVTNNEHSNLRPLCRGCNVSRSGRPSTKRYAAHGVAMTLTEWAEAPGVPVGRAQIAKRLKSGWPVERALFGPNKTHPNRAMTRELKA